MNKTELIARVAESAEMTKTDAARAVNALLATITDTLQTGESVTVIGFGTFNVRTRAARQGRNPRTGKKMKIKAAKVPAFKAGKRLKDAVS